MASLSGQHRRTDSEYQQVALHHADDHTPNTAVFGRGHQTHYDSSTMGAHRPADSLSLHSNTPLAPQQTYQHMPPMPGTHSTDSAVITKDFSSGSTPARPYGAGTDSTRPNSSWDLLAGIRKFEHEYSEFDTRNATQPHLRFADGDVPKNKVCCSVFPFIRSSDSCDCVA